MTRRDVIKKYKQDRSIQSNYVLDEDENYLIDEIVKALKQVKKFNISGVSKSLPSSEYIWIQGRSESDRRVFIEWFEQYR